MTMITLATFATAILSTSIWTFGRLDRESKLSLVENLEE